MPIVAAPTQVLISAGAASIAIEDNFAHTRVLSPGRLCRDVPEFHAGGKGGGVRLEEGLRRMITAMDRGVLPRRGPAGVLTGQPGERTWTSALTVVDALAGMCAGLKLPAPPPQLAAPGLSNALPPPPVAGKLAGSDTLATTASSKQQRVVRIAFCGAGKQAAVLAATVVAAVTGSGSSRFEIVGVCDASLDAAQRFADKFGDVSTDAAGADATAGAGAGVEEEEEEEAEAEEAEDASSSLSPSPCIVTTDIEELCATAQADGLIIATPPSVRLAPITAAAKAKIPIFLEKPPATTMDVAERCLDVLRCSWRGDNGDNADDDDTVAVSDTTTSTTRPSMADAAALPCCCAVGFQLRLAPGVLRLRDLAASRAVHAVRTIATVPMYHPSVEAQYGAGGPRACDLSQSETGGALVSQAIHILDAARFVLGSPKVRRARCLEGGEQQMRFATKEDSSASSSKGGGGGGGGGGGNEQRGVLAADVSSVVQQLYELEGGIYGTHCNHCGTTDWIWELELVGPDLAVTLSVGIPISTLRGTVDGVTVCEVFDDRSEALSSASVSAASASASASAASAISVSGRGEPKVHAWLSELLVHLAHAGSGSIGTTTTVATPRQDEGEGGGGGALCSYAEAVASLELALALQPMA